MKVLAKLPGIRQNRKGRLDGKRTTSNRMSTGITLMGIFVALGEIVLIDIAYNDVAAGILGLPTASQIYFDLGWFPPIS